MTPHLFPDLEDVGADGIFTASETSPDELAALLLGGVLPHISDADVVVTLVASKAEAHRQAHSARELHAALPTVPCISGRNLTS